MLENGDFLIWKTVIFTWLRQALYWVNSCGFYQSLKYRRSFDAFYSRQVIFKNQSQRNRKDQPTYFQSHF